MVLPLFLYSDMKIASCWPGENLNLEFIKGFVKRNSLLVLHILDSDKNKICELCLICI